MGTKKQIICLGIIVLLIFSLTSCQIDFEIEPTPIKNGFSKEMVSMLKEKFHLDIPKDAVFVEGEYDNAIQDDAVHIKFIVPSNECDSLYDDTWFESKQCSADGSDTAEREMEYSKEMFTCLCFQPANDDGTVTVYFQGRHPVGIIT